MTILSNGSQNTVNKGLTPNVPPHNKPGGPPGFRDCPSVSDYPLPPAVRRTKYRGARTNPWDPIGSLACATVIVLLIQWSRQPVGKMILDGICDSGQLGEFNLNE